MKYADMFLLRYPWQLGVSLMAIPDGLVLENTVAQSARLVGKFVEDMTALAFGRVDMNEWCNESMGRSAPEFVEKIAVGLADLHTYEFDVLYSRILAAMPSPGSKVKLRGQGEWRPFVRGPLGIAPLPNGINEGIGFMPECIEDDEFNALFITNIGYSILVARMPSIDLEWNPA